MSSASYVPGQARPQRSMSDTRLTRARSAGPDCQPTLHRRCTRRVPDRSCWPIATQTTTRKSSAGRKVESDAVQVDLRKGVQFHSGASSPARRQVGLLRVRDPKLKFRCDLATLYGHLTQGSTGSTPRGGSSIHDGIRCQAPTRTYVARNGRYPCAAYRLVSAGTARCW